MKQNNDSMTDILEQFKEPLNSLLALQREAGRSMLQLMTDSGGRLMDSVMQETTRQKSPSGCDIPEPCWMPVSLGELCTEVCAGQTASVTFCIENSDFRSRVMHAYATGQSAGMAGFEPNQISLGPKERGEIRVALTVPEKAKECDSFEALIWIRGCKNYYLRWTVRVAKQSAHCCEKISFADGQDYKRHWYDYFYHTRTCQPLQLHPDRDGNNG